MGVDSSAPALEQARKSAKDRKLTGRVTFEEADAAEWEGGEFDVVLCVGASHAFGGLAKALPAARSHLKPGGRLLLGEGVWEGPPTPEALAAMQAEPGDLQELPNLVTDLRRFGFEPGFGHVSTPAEWDYLRVVVDGRARHLGAGGRRRSGPRRWRPPAPTGRNGWPAIAGSWASSPSCCTTSARTPPADRRRRLRPRRQW